MKYKKFGSLMKNKELMNELGETETMDHIDNALDIINNIDKPRNTSKNG